MLAIHDVSCFGKCSLTVALPIISAAGAECAVLPTAVLSTHTGGFEGFTYRDMTGDLLPIVDHWKSLGLRFDYIYTGFLGSFEQIDMVGGIIDRLRDGGTTVVVDPVMADNGELYKVFPEEFPEGMRGLCGKADVILPNITEASLLTGSEYREGPHSEGYAEGLLSELRSVCPGSSVLTGVEFDGGALEPVLFGPGGRGAYAVITPGARHYLGAACGSPDGRVSYALHSLIPGRYHGTGDVFGSAVVAALANGLSLDKAAEIAVRYTAGSILRTAEAGTDVRFGVDFEAGIGGLIEDLKR